MSLSYLHGSARTFVRCASVLVFVVPTMASAQLPDAERMFRELDRNRDGSISADDASDNNRQFLENILRMGNKPATGTLSRQEFQTVFDAHQAGAGRQPMPPTNNPGATPQPQPQSPDEGAAPGVAEALLRVCDQNGDGRVTRAEWSRLTQQFRTLDRDSNDALDAAELSTLGAERGAASTSTTGERTPPAASPNGRASLDGTWRGWVVRGRGEDTNSGEMEMELVVRGNQMEARELGTNRAPGGLGAGTYTVGAGGAGTLDAVQTTGQESGRNYIGVYEVTGDTLRWCVTGRNRTRPTTMATDRGNYLLVLRRQAGR
jgi:uncharacterized protein (TIGR03067 family)